MNKDTDILHIHYNKNSIEDSIKWPPWRWNGRCLLQHNASGCEVIWKKAYELLYVLFLRHEQFFVDRNVIALVSIKRNHGSCHGMTHISLIVGDWNCSVFMKTSMEPGPWTLITYSAYVLVSWTQAMWHSLCGMWRNSKPLSMLSLVFTQASPVLISYVSCWGRRYCWLFYMFFIYLPLYSVSKLTLGSTGLKEFVVKEDWRLWA